MRQLPRWSNMDRSLNYFPSRPKSPLEQLHQIRLILDWLILEYCRLLAPAVLPREFVRVYRVELRQANAEGFRVVKGSHDSIPKLRNPRGDQTHPIPRGLRCLVAGRCLGPCVQQPQCGSYISSLTLRDPRLQCSTIAMQIALQWQLQHSTVCGARRARQRNCTAISQVLPADHVVHP
jgi:hypothetical protein